MWVIAVLVGVVIGVSLGALGGGGSILTVPALVYALGQPPQTATTASLIIVGVTSITAAAGHARARRVRWLTAAVFGVLGIVASLGGSRLNRAVDPQILMLSFAALMLVAAAAMFARSRRPNPSCDASDAVRPPTAPVARALPRGRARGRARSRGVAGNVRVVSVALVVGFLTGFLGVGGGFLIVPALVLAMGFTMPVAVGTSLVIISMTSLGAFAERLGHAAIPWAVVIPFTIAAIAGSLLGKRAADKVSETVLTRSFASLLILVAVYVVVQVSGKM